MKNSLIVFTTLILWNFFHIDFFAAKVINLNNVNSYNIESIGNEIERLKIKTIMNNNVFTGNNLKNNF